jgi:hypothetical protein
MVDYFNNENAATTDGNATTNGVAQQQGANGEDLGMTEISVSFYTVPNAYHGCR